MIPMICWHIIMGHEIWIDNEIAPEPVMAFLLLGHRKWTARIQLKKGLANKFYEKISK